MITFNLNQIMYSTSQRGKWKDDNCRLARDNCKSNWITVPLLRGDINASGGFKPESISRNRMRAGYAIMTLGALETFILKVSFCNNYAGVPFRNRNRLVKEIRFTKHDGVI